MLLWAYHVSYLGMFSLALNFSGFVYLKSELFGAYALFLILILRIKRPLCHHFSPMFIFPWITRRQTFQRSRYLQCLKVVGKPGRSIWYLSIVRLGWRSKHLPTGECLPKLHRFHVAGSDSKGLHLSCKESCIYGYIAKMVVHLHLPSDKNMSGLIKSIPESYKIQFYYWGWGVWNNRLSILCLKYWDH